MLLAVVDTNIYVSALVFGGTPARLLQLADLGAFQIVISKTIKAELEETLTSKFGWSAGRVAAATEELWRNSRFITPEHPLKVSRDPDDDHILACALEAHAQLILTGDNDLLSLHPFQGIEILSPAQFLSRFEARPPGA